MWNEKIQFICIHAYYYCKTKQIIINIMIINLIVIILLYLILPYIMLIH